MHLQILAIFLAAVVVLVGCGGNDAPVVPSTSDPLENLPPGVGTAATEEVDNFQLGFGSVHISDGSVTGVKTSFTNGRVIATISRNTGSDITLDTDDSFGDTGNIDSAVGLSGRQARSRAVISTTSSSGTLSSGTVGLVVVDWATTNPQDYLAGGYWLHFQNTDPLEVEVGAFVDGPELSTNNAPDLSTTTGTAVYRGVAGGMYAAEYGTDATNWEGVNPGGIEVGEFAGIATLTADFGAGQISGCIGCDQNIEVYGAYFDEHGNYREFETTTGLQVVLESATITNGQFDGDVNIRGGSSGMTITASDGIWGGQFSNMVNDDGKPRLIAGVVGGEGSTAGGTNAAFIGAFGAGLQP